MTKRILLLLLLLTLVPPRLGAAKPRTDANNDGRIRFAHVSDIEGAVAEAEKAAAVIAAKSPDMVIITGDVYENEDLRRHPVFPDSTDNVGEMFRGIEPFARLGVPVYVIPGNHESREVYSRGIKKLRQTYPNVEDISGRALDLKGLNIVGMAGYYHPRFTHPDGFVNTKQDYVTAFNQIFGFQDQDTVLLATHSPPYAGRDTETESRMDYVTGAGHVGDKNLTVILENASVFNLCGHIHEGGAAYATFGRSQSFQGASITPYTRNKPEPVATVFEIVIRESGNSISFVD